MLPPNATRNAFQITLIMIKKFLRASALLFLGAGLVLNTFSGDNPTTGGPGEIAAAGKKFLATLDDAQRSKVVFDFKDDAQRKRWSNLKSKTTLLRWASSSVARNFF